jgi:hypothetical protein
LLTSTPSASVEMAAALHDAIEFDAGAYATLDEHRSGVVLFFFISVIYSSGLRSPRRVGRSSDTVG